MVEASIPDAPKRRDGWLERRGFIGEVTIGSLVAGRNRTDRWEIIDLRTPEQYEHDHSPWMRMRNQVTGEEISVPPRNNSRFCTFLFRDDEAEPPERTPPSDFEEVKLLVDTLGATVLCRIDNASGEITAPDYEGTFATMSGDHNDQPEEFYHHLEIMHGMDVSGLRELPREEQAAAKVIAHGRSHNPSHPAVGKGGVPHRHVPERGGFQRVGNHYV